jgi:diguanylate cyclase
MLQFSQFAGLVAPIMTDHGQRPPEIARQTLLRLALERIPPTPDNFHAYYEKISGCPADGPFPDRELKLIASALPGDTDGRKTLVRQLEHGIATRDWPLIKQSIVDLCVSDPPTARLNGNAVPHLPPLFAHLLRDGIARAFAESGTLALEAQDLANTVMLTDASAPTNLGARVHTLTNKVEGTAEDQRAVRAALHELLTLIVRNVSDIVLDDHWLSGQLDLLARLLDDQPDIRRLEDVKCRLGEVIDKQRALKQQLIDARSRLNDMFASFVGRLSEFTHSTGSYHETLTHYVAQLTQTADPTQLAEIIATVLAETRTVQASAKRSTEDLEAMQREVQTANDHIAHLQRSLDQTSELLRHDPLTGVLNRKGLDEAIEREMALAQRRGTVLCIALLDIDDFKALNDTFGHIAGDEALRHIAEVMREALRPQDLAGRYGGEEFIILMPDTDENESTLAMERLQRALTKRFFLTNNQRILITFSAGIARLACDEPPGKAIDRADRAMYAAKRAGKNRVFIFS